MEIKELSTANFEQTIKTNRYVFVDFYADWCGPCKMLSPVIDQIAQEYENKNILFAKVNIDRNREVAMMFNIQSIPTMMIFRLGNVENSLIGYKPKEDIKRMINDVIKLG